MSKIIGGCGPAANQ
nr:hypothetical protein [Citrobacter freundii]